MGAAVLLFHKRRRYARLYSIAVAEHARGVGLGAALLAAAEREAIARGAQALILEVRPDNAGARRLYEAAGYSLFAMQPEFYADGASAARYEKRFAAPARLGD